MIVTNSFLKSSNVIDIGSIPIYSEDYINESNNLTQKQIDEIVFPEMLSPLQQEFKYFHYKVYNLRPKSMFRLATIGVLPSIFLYFKDDVPLCSSCIFGTSRRGQWITKGNKSWSISKETDNNTLASVSLDQLQSYHPVLFPHLSVKLTTVRIWSVQLTVDHFSYVTYVRIIIITIQYYFLSVKSDFEIWAATVGVKINR